MEKTDSEIQEMHLFIYSFIRARNRH